MMNMQMAERYSDPNISTQGIVEQFKQFAQRCEELKLYAAAAHVFQKLMRYDPDNKRAYFERFLANIQHI
ncbi:hypothetical protein U14_02649 [Candidatus Moduliflexus flocculans]|uniref:Uncharacterized protein n=1 Tax=Candidatus Moduliflexus flocculans TaxID=1499966 RepID=A0A081BLY9_9BACT|nr:hypothetical protein U14_02649 [Candidatus Moduliflexus flocculans]